MLKTLFLFPGVEDFDGPYGDVGASRFRTNQNQDAAITGNNFKKPYRFVGESPLPKPSGFLELPQGPLA